jgi:hypothetical protein
LHAGSARALCARATARAELPAPSCSRRAARAELLVPSASGVRAQMKKSKSKKGVVDKMCEEILVAMLESGVVVDFRTGMETRSLEAVINRTSVHESDAKEVRRAFAAASLAASLTTDGSLTACPYLMCVHCGAARAWPSAQYGVVVFRQVEKLLNIRHNPAEAKTSELKFVRAGV